MSKRFDGKVALVTGATSGIGRDTALAFAREGAAVVVTGRRADRGEALAKEIEALGAKALYVKADASNEADAKRTVDETIKAFGRLDIAFNNAGVEGELGPIVEQTEANYRQVFDINVWGGLASMKFEIPAMLESGGGSIINNASVAGLVGMPGGSVYFGSKHAVIGLTKVAALEVAESGIRVNAVAPAVIQTDMADRFFGDDPDAQKNAAAMHPMNRVGQPREITDPVLFLASNDASFITGHTLTIDGGFVAR